MGFAAGDENLKRYVGGHPTIAADPSGLEDPTIDFDRLQERIMLTSSDRCTGNWPVRTPPDFSLPTTAQMYDGSLELYEGWQEMYASWQEGPGPTILGYAALTARIIHTKIFRFVEPTRDSLRLIDM